jgi:trk system potassium uptake protein TrkH
MIGKSEINLLQVTHILGFLLLVIGGFMLTGIPFSLYYGEDSYLPLLYGSMITVVSGALMWLTTRKHSKDTINKREGFLVVSLAWVAISIFGSIPFIIHGHIPSFTDAFFETMSGFTTTGASILTNVEALPKGLLFWRSMTHWIGGMGIIVLSVAILPFLGIGGMQLYAAEMPGVTKDKLHPRITETAKRLWIIYVALTFIQTALLLIGGMNLFESLCHSFGSMATGGFGVKNDSIASYSPYLQYVIIVFMTLAGTNFTLHYLALQGRFRQIARNEEFRKYLYLLIFFSLIVTFVLVFQAGMHGEKAFRAALFQVVSIVTTTGFATSDYLLWPGALWFFIFLLMFVGGMAGSTGGGIKVVRQLLLFKNAGKELKRAIHPQGVIPVRLNREAVSQDTIFKVMAFFQIYILVFVFGAMGLSFLGLDFETAIGASIAALGNIGPGIGLVGPAGNFAFIPDAGKWLLSLLMLLGRLELFTVLILISSSFWKR